MVVNLFKKVFIIVASCAVCSTAFAQNKIELNQTALDLAWEKRDTMPAAYTELAISRPELPANYEVLWRVARAIYYAGNFLMLKEKNEAKISYYQYGLDAALKATKLSPGKPDGYFWYAINAGSLGLSKGVRASLNLAEPIRDACTEVIKIDPSYFDYGAYRIRGRLYFKLPALISFGNNKKSYEDLKIAADKGKCKVNHLYFAEVQAKIDNKKAALETLHKAKNIADTCGKEEEKSFRNGIDELEKDLN